MKTNFKFWYVPRTRMRERKKVIQSTGQSIFGLIWSSKREDTKGGKERVNKDSDRPCWTLRLQRTSFFCSTQCGGKCISKSLCKKTCLNPNICLLCVSFSWQPCSVCFSDETFKTQIPSSFLSLLNVSWKYSIERGVHAPQHCTDCAAHSEYHMRQTKR